MHGARKTGAATGDDGERICVGVIGAPHGVRGLVKVRSFTGEPGQLFAYGPLSDEAGGRRFRLTPAGQAKGGLVARVEGVADRTAAEALTGTRLYVSRDALPAPREDEFYYADLVGLRVELRDGTMIGRIKAIHDFGAGDVVEIAPAGAQSNWGGKAMLPFTAEAVPVVDIAGGRIVIEPPPGLFEAVEDDGAEGGAGEAEPGP